MLLVAEKFKNIPLSKGESTKEIVPDKLYQLEQDESGFLNSLPQTTRNNETKDLTKNFSTNSN